MHECKAFVYKRYPPRTLAQINADLVTGFSVTGSEAGYSDTVDGDYSDFGEAYGLYRGGAEQAKGKAVDQSTAVVAQAAQDLMFKITRQR